MQFVNIHTHKPSDNNSSEITNLVVGRDSIDNILPERFYSIGIHPWYTENLQKSKEILTQYAAYPYIIAIGECGFDSKSLLSLSEQESLFVYHVELSEKLDKPLIIHSVKTVNETIRLKKILKPKMPWVIHGFNSNAQTAKECIKHGLFMSVGHLLCNGETSIAKIVDQVPLTHLFFETDESDLPIDAIYEQYALLTGKSIKNVTETIYANFARNFLKKDGNN
ncbi:MAG TPA: TatD family hydrolase [Bacteroidales bacterium]|nr:TatD family hydrolase [Bacteroidales bacterium]